LNEPSVNPFARLYKPMVGFGVGRWTLVPEAENRYLRVVLLEDGEMVHNAFFDSNFKP
jgi:hypothetical protein